MKDYFLLLALGLLWPQSANATRIYSFVDYPDLQNGHSLRGTITTTDDAPEDGLLQTEEILDWEWEISGANNLSATLIEESSTHTNNIRITETHITFVLDSNSSMKLTAPHFTPEILLQWVTFGSSGVEDPFVSNYSAGFRGRDSVIPYWKSDVRSLGGVEWVVAKVIPEPSCALLACLLFPHIALTRTLARNHKQ